MKKPKSGMKIPKSFQLAGVTWCVEETAAMNEMGHCEAETATIRIRKGLSQQMKEATFCHELQHAIRFAAGETDHDGKTVDAHGNLLHQFLNTWK